MKPMMVALARGQALEIFMLDPDGTIPDRSKLGIVHADDGSELAVGHWPDGETWERLGEVSRDPDAPLLVDGMRVLELVGKLHAANEKIDGDPDLDDESWEAGYAGGIEECLSTLGLIPREPAT